MESPKLIPETKRDLKLLPLLRLAIIPVVVIGGLVTAWKLGYFDIERRQHLSDVAKGLHALQYTEAIYVALYALAIVLLLPSTVGSLVGGALFGAVEGGLLAWLGALAGTVVAHLLARHVARAPMQKMFGQHRLLRRLKEHDDILELLRLRILPVAPFATLDYVAGVAGVSLPRLLLATMIGALPSVVAYAYVGSQLMRGIATRTDASHRALWVAGVVSVVMLLLSVVPGLIQRLRD